MPDHTWSTFPDDPFLVVALAASAGGFRALETILAALPADFPVPVLIALHRAAEMPSWLEQLLARVSAIPVVRAEHGMAVKPGAVYFAPPGFHASVSASQRIMLESRTTKEFACPSADMLFTSLASCYGHRVIAVVLSGMGRDGARGAEEVRRRGGFVIAQDEQTAAHFDMPYATIETRKADLVLPVDRIGLALRVLLEERLPSPGQDAAAAGGTSMTSSGSVTGGA